MRTIVALILGGVCLLSTANLRAQDDAALANLYGEGVHAFHNGEFKTAHQYFSDAITAGYQNPLGYYFRGLSSVKLGRTDEAKQDFSAGAALEAGSFNPDLPNVVSRSLERVQGEIRVVLEKSRSTAKVNLIVKRNSGGARRAGADDGEDTGIARRAHEPSAERPPLAAIPEGSDSVDGTFDSDDTETETPAKTKVDTKEEESLDDLLGDDDDKEDAPVEKPKDDAKDGDLDDLFGDDDGKEDAPVEKPKDDAKEEDLDDLLGDDDDKEDAPVEKPKDDAKEEDLDDLFGDDDAKEDAPVEKPKDAPKEEDLDDLLGEDDAKEDAPVEKPKDAPKEEDLDDLLGEDDAKDGDANEDDDKKEDSPKKDTKEDEELESLLDDE